jgi:hypothetical protein
MSSDTEPVTYLCCLCGAAIGPGHRLDPCSLILVTNFSTAREGQREQQFCCHFACFRERNRVGSLYIAEPEFPTIGELSAESGTQEPQVTVQPSGNPGALPDAPRRLMQDSTGLVALAAHDAAWGETSTSRGVGLQRLSRPHGRGADVAQRAAERWTDQ